MAFRDEPSERQAATASAIVKPAIIRLMRGSRDMTLGLQELVAWADPRPDAHLVEIGSYAGESAAIFRMTGRFQRITCVDVWSNPTTKLAERYFDVRARGFDLEKWRMDSAVAAQAIEDASLDLVYIDAWHHYDDVIRDIQAWRSKIRAGGVLAGHDYGLGAGPESVPDHEVEPHRCWPDVVRAVDDSFGIPHRVFRDDSWAVRL